MSKHWPFGAAYSVRKTPTQPLHLMIWQRRIGIWEGTRKQRRWPEKRCGSDENCGERNTWTWRIRCATSALSWEVKIGGVKPKIQPRRILRCDENCSDLNIHLLRRPSKMLPGQPAACDSSTKRIGLMRRP